MGNFNEIIKKAKYEGFLLDGCGTDERYYTFGAFIDLCGATPEELMPKCCGESSSSSSDDKKAINLIDTNISKNASGWQLAISSQNPITSDLQLTVTYIYNVNGERKEGSEVFLLPDNSKDSVYYLTLDDNATDVEIIERILEPTSDYSYEYKINKNETDIDKLYYGIVQSKKIDTISYVDILKMDSLILQNGDNDICFTILPTPIDNLNNLSEIEVAEKIKDNSYDLLIAMPSKITDFQIIDSIGENDQEFKLFKNILINDIQYSLFKRSDTNTQVNIYDPSELNDESSSDISIYYSINII